MPAVGHSDDDGMLIGQLAGRAGVDPPTIRYYERIGLLPHPARTAAGYRRYGPDDLDRLAFIHRAKRLDLRLGEITEILAVRDRGQAPCHVVVEVAERRLAEIETRITELHRVRAELRDLLDRDPAAQPAAGCCHLIER